MRTPIIAALNPIALQFGPFTIHSPVRVMRMRHTEKASANHVHQPPGLKCRRTIGAMTGRGLTDS